MINRIQLNKNSIASKIDLLRSISNLYSWTKLITALLIDVNKPVNQNDNHRV